MDSKSEFVAKLKADGFSAEYINAVVSFSDYALGEDNAESMATMLSFMLAVSADMTSSPDEFIDSICNSSKKAIRNSKNSSCGRAYVEV